MKIEGWLTSSLDINHGQHFYKGDVSKKKVKVKIDFGMDSRILEGKINGTCKVTIPKLPEKPEKSLKASDPAYYQRRKDERKLFKESYVKIANEVFEKIKEAANEEGYSVKAMKMKIKRS